MKPETIQMIEAAQPVAAELAAVVDNAAASGFQAAPIMLALAAVAGRLVVNTAATKGLDPDEVRTMFNRMVDNAQARSLERAAATRN